ncbi:hypothetical protein J3A83DRAFT_200603 [Scleroderma citrinum]
MLGLHSVSAQRSLSIAGHRIALPSHIHYKLPALGVHDYPAWRPSTMGVQFVYTSLCVCFSRCCCRLAHLSISIATSSIHSLMSRFPLYHLPPRYAILAHAFNFFPPSDANAPFFPCDLHSHLMNHNVYYTYAMHRYRFILSSWCITSRMV